MKPYTLPLSVLVAGILAAAWTCLNWMKAKNELAYQKERYQTCVSIGEQIDKFRKPDSRIRILDGKASDRVERLFEIASRSGTGKGSTSITEEPIEYTPFGICNGTLTGGGNISMKKLAETIELLSISGVQPVELRLTAAKTQVVPANQTEEFWELAEFHFRYIQDANLVPSE